MPVYARTPGLSEQRRHPSALILIIGGHAALIAAVMTAKMAIPIIDKGGPIVIDSIPIPPDPPPNPEPRKQTDKPQPPVSTPYVPPAPVPIPVPRPDVDTTPIPIPPTTDPIIGTNPSPRPAPGVVPAVVRTGPRFVTPEWAVEPPYPDDKRRLEEEAVLRLRLSIDERGRVVAVDPLGRADRSFLQAARRHVIAHWRYKPATEDGRPVASSTVVTLRFELES
jgi:protein TonB